MLCVVQPRRKNTQFTADMQELFISKYGERGERLSCSEWDTKWATWLTCYAEGEKEIARLREALQNAHSGFDLAYDALEKGCYDEAMLHCGHHHAQSGKALTTHNVQVQRDYGGIIAGGSAGTKGSTTQEET